MAKQLFAFTEHPRSRKTRPDPFADPLEREEWQGLLWVVPMLAWLVNGHPAKARVASRSKARKARPASHRPARA